MGFLTRRQSHAQSRPVPDLGPASERSVRGLEGCARDRAGGLRRPRFDGADVAGGALAARPGARAALDRRHRRSRLASRGRARSARRQAPCTHARSAPPHAALERRQTEDRIAGRGARGALSPAGAGSAGERRDAYPHRAYPRRSGRDAVDADAARQRYRRPRGDGARDRARWRVAGAAVAGHPEIPARRDARQGQDRLRRRSDQPRHEFHASAVACVDACAGGGGGRQPQPGAAGLAGWRGPMPRSKCWSMAPSAILR